MKYQERKESILEHIDKNPGTYLNSIVTALKKNKNNVSKIISELLQEKQIIPLTDSRNSEYSKVKRVINSRVVQLVCYDEVEEKRGESFNIEPEKPKVLPISRKNTEVTRYLDLMISYLKKTIEINELRLKRYRESSESEKAILNDSITDEMIKEQIDTHSKIAVARDNLDSRIKFSKSQKLMMAYYMKNEYTVRGMAKRTGYSSKYCSRLHNNTLSEIGLGNLGEFNFNKTDPAFPKLREILGQCTHCNVWVVDSLCE